LGLYSQIYEKGYKKMMSAKNQSVIAVIITFIFYFAWAFWANQSAITEQVVLIRIALVQAIYSALMTAFFSNILISSLIKFKCNKYPLMAVIPAILFQLIAVVLVNLGNQTPNLILTVLPSIFFGSVYGVLFAKRLLKTEQFSCIKTNEKRFKLYEINN
jgi:uncharacterized membrane protein YfcA